METTEGLEKAVKGGYGFFVSATLARRALRTSLLHDRCSLKELVIPQTITVIALPMSVNCPYKKIINLRWIMVRHVEMCSETKVVNVFFPPLLLIIIILLASCASRKVVS